MWLGSAPIPDENCFLRGTSYVWMYFAKGCKSANDILIPIILPEPTESEYPTLGEPNPQSIVSLETANQQGWQKCLA